MRGEAGARGGAGEDGDEAQAGVGGGLGINRGVADVDGIRGGDPETLEGEEEARGVRLEGGDVFGAEDVGEGVEEALALEDFLDAVAQLLADDGER